MKNIILILVVNILLLISFTGCEDTFNDEVEVLYTVSGTPSGFSITYDKNGNTEQKTTTQSRWTKSFTGTSGDFVYVSAQAQNESANVTVKITIDGSQLKTATSQGDYVIATASGTIP